MVADIIADDFTVYVYQQVMINVYRFKMFFDNRHTACEIQTMGTSVPLPDSVLQ